MSQKLYQSLNDITPVVTAHGEGEKFVFLSQHDVQTSITQFALGKLLPGEKIDHHLHPSMEECFYFITGEGEYEINGSSYEIKPCSFFRVPVNTNHCLIAKGNQPLTFVYFGVALNE